MAVVWKPSWLWLKAFMVHEAYKWLSATSFHSFLSKQFELSLKACSWLLCASLHSHSWKLSQLPLKACKWLLLETCAPFPWQEGEECGQLSLQCYAQSKDCTKKCFWVSAMVAISETVKKNVEKILGSGEPVLVTVQKLTSFLLESGLAYKALIKPGEVLVHPQNRSGSMLSAVDCWAKGMRMWKVGVRKELLTESFAFELALCPQARNEQLAANRALVANTPQLLAPLTGKERFLSVSSSHTTAWLKAVEAGCQAPGDDHVLQLRQGEERSDAIIGLLNQGWTWIVFSAAVEAEWKQLPSWLQLALNSTNSNAKQLSEVECAAQLAQGLQQGQSLKLALEVVKACDTACKSSLDCIAKYVSKFAGGKDAPIITFLSKFGSLVEWHIFWGGFLAQSGYYAGCLCHFWSLHPGKSYGTLMVGEEMMRAISSFEMKNSDNLLPFLRASMCLGSMQGQLSKPLVASWSLLWLSALQVFCGCPKPLMAISSVNLSKLS